MPRLGSRVRVSFPAPNPEKGLVGDGGFHFQGLSPRFRRKYKKALCEGLNDVSSDTSDHRSTGIFDSVSNCKSLSNAGLPFLGDWRLVLLDIVSLEMFETSTPFVSGHLIIFLNKRVCCVICLRN